MLSLIQLIFPWLDSPRADALDVLKSSVLPSLKLEPDPPDDELEAADKEDDPEVDIEEVPELPIVLLKRSVPDLIDRRKVPRKERSERGRGRGQRSLEGMNAFMVHQTAVLMSVEQADGVPAPCVIYPDGQRRMELSWLVGSRVFLVMKTRYGFPRKRKIRLSLERLNPRLNSWAGRHLSS